MSKIRDVLDDIYSRLPKVACKGLCFECCGPIAGHAEEFKILERKSGKPTTFSAVDGRCVHLNADNRCAVYRDRPYVCRLWGTTPKLHCPYGCQPDRPFTDAEGQQLMLKMCDQLGDRLVHAQPDDWELCERLHRTETKRTLMFGPVHAPWPDDVTKDENLP